MFYRRENEVDLERKLIMVEFPKRQAVEKMSEPAERQDCEKKEEESNEHKGNLTKMFEQYTAIDKSGRS